MPHTYIALAAQHLLLAATTAKKPATNASSTIIFVVIIAAIAYFLLIRPQRRRAQRAQQVQASIEIGDEVMLTSGIIGRVTWLEGDRARVEIAPNTEVEVVKQALGRKVTPPVPETVEGDDETAGEQSESGSGDVKLPYTVAGNHSAEETASPVGNGTPAVPADSEDREGT